MSSRQNRTKQGTGEQPAKEWSQVFRVKKAKGINTFRGSVLSCDRRQYVQL